MNLPANQGRPSDAKRKEMDAISEASGGEGHQYLTFTLSGEMFAAGIMRIKEILEFDQITPVPMMPEFIRGVLNLRGATPASTGSYRLRKNRPHWSETGVRFYLTRTTNDCPSGGRCSSPAPWCRW